MLTTIVNKLQDFLLVCSCARRQNSPSIASGSKVLLPAPGGALTISVFWAERCSLTAGMISRTGRSMVKGLKGKALNKL
jgi:hypothetical protein